MTRCRFFGVGLMWIALMSQTACQHAPMSPQQQLQLGLGVSQTDHVQHAETLLHQALDGFTQAQDLQGQSQAAFALGELYKSTRWQQTQQPPATLESYQRSGEYFERAAQGYQTLHQPLVAGSAYIGAANAALLADRLSQACQYHRQAIDLAQASNSVDQQTAQAQLHKNLNFFVDLAVVCLAQP